MQQVARKLFCCGLGLLPLLGCSGGDERAHAAALDDGTPPDLHQVGVEPCAEPDLGCPCEEEGVTLSCGNVTEFRGTYRICSPGGRLCADGVWGECLAVGPGVEMATETGAD